MCVFEHKNVIRILSNVNRTLKKEKIYKYYL
jgi:hypothetical protein